MGAYLIRVVTPWNWLRPALRFEPCHDGQSQSGARNQQSRVLWLGLWMAGSIASYIGAALAVRALAKSLSVFEMMSVRSASGLVLLLGLMAVAPNIRRGVTPRRIGLHLARNSVQFVGQILWALAITLLPFASVFALEFTAPIWVALLAVLFLGERLTLARAASIAVSLVGVLAILRPGFASFGLAVLLALGAAVTRALASVATKKLTQTESTFAILFWMNVMQLPMNLAGSDPLFIVRLAPGMALPLIGLAVTGLSVHLCMAQAFRYGDAIAVVPLDFLRVPLIALIGWSFYGEALDALVLAGSSLIMASVIANLRTEARADAQSGYSALRPGDRGGARAKITLADMVRRFSLRERLRGAIPPYTVPGRSAS
jgi:drug/metabolite transporter (DMT)-like permease